MTRLVLLKHAVAVKEYYKVSSARAFTGSEGICAVLGKIIFEMISNQNHESLIDLKS